MKKNFSIKIALPLVLTTILMQQKAILATQPSWSKTIMRDGIRHQFSVTYDDIKKILPDLRDAVQYGDFQTLNKLVQTYSCRILEEIDSNGNSLFFYAKQPKMIQYLVELILKTEIINATLLVQMLINKKNHNGLTPLEIEVIANNLNITERAKNLILYGADVSSIKAKIYELLTLINRPAQIEEIIEAEEERMVEDDSTDFLVINFES